jgi:hypothetical protein
MTDEALRRLSAHLDVTTSARSRERLLDGDIARALFEDVVAQDYVRGLISDHPNT